MSDNASEVRVDIKTTADTSGAQAVSSALGQVKQAAQEVGQEGVKMGEKVAHGADDTANPLKDLLIGIKAGKLESIAFAEIMKGDFTSAVKIATVAIKGFKAAGAAGGLGLLAAAASFAAPLLISLAKHLFDAGAGADHAGKKSDEAAPHIKEVGDKAGEAAPKVQTFAEKGDAAKKAMDEAKGAADLFIASLAEVATKAGEALTALDNLAKEQQKQRKETASQMEGMGEIKPSQKERIQARDEHDTTAESLDRKAQAAQAQKAAAENAISVIKNESGNFGAEAAKHQGKSDLAKKAADIDEWEAQNEKDWIDKKKAQLVIMDGRSAEVGAIEIAIGEAEKNAAVLKARAQAKRIEQQSEQAEADKHSATAIGLQKDIPKAEESSAKASAELAQIAAEKETNDAQFVTKMVHAATTETKENTTPTPDQKESAKRATEAAEQKREAERLAHEGKVKTVETQIQAKELELSSYKSSGPNAQKIQAEIGVLKLKKIDIENEGATDPDKLAAAGLLKTATVSATTSKIHEMQKKDAIDNAPEDPKKPDKKHRGRDEFHIDAHAPTAPGPQTPHTDFHQATQPNDAWIEQFKSGAAKHAEAAQKAQQIAQQITQNGVELSSAMSAISAALSAQKAQINANTAAFKAMKSWAS